MTKSPLYCYVDESGQDTRGLLFVVGVVVTGPERDHLRGLCERFEQTSRKGQWKWVRASHGRQVAYIGHHLRQSGIRVRKVRGVRDQSDALIRLADALCGMVRAATEGQPELRRLLERGVESGVIHDVSR